MANIFDFNLCEIVKLSRDAIDLLKKLLDPNPLTRPSAKEALQH